MRTLTPVEKRNGIYLKRDDLYQPFGEGTVNGGKLRQCMALIDHIKDDHYDGVISCCSVYSPQSPITSAVAKHYGMKAVICYGGTTEERLKRFRMCAIAKRYGAELRIISKSGIHNILYQKAKSIAKAENLFVVDYGFNIIDYPEVMYTAVSRQVENIPDNLDNLVIVCGSGITSIGVMLGLKEYNKKVKRVYLVATAPNREKKINDALESAGAMRKYVVIDLFHQEGFKYERGLVADIDGIALHPNYEAKAYAWLLDNIPAEQNTLLWIVGSKPMR